MRQPHPARLTRRAALSALAAPFAAAQQRRPPNIVLILADDLGWADLAAYGADLHETPHTTRLAGESIRFTNAYAAAPVCSPTRAAIMTGKHPARLGITTWHESALNPPKNRKLIPPVAVANLPLEETTIAERLHNAGYFTAAVGKWHLGTGGFYPENQGFDVNTGGTFWGAPQTFFWPYRGTRHFGGEARYVPGLPFGRPGEYLTDRLTDEALTVIDHAAGRPFFLYLAHHAPHTPVEGKADKVARYRAKITPGMHHRNPEYAAMVESFDESVGRVMDRLRERGLEQDTLLIVTSDNGGFINPYEGQAVTDNAPLRSGKGSLYEGGLRVPLFLRWPGAAAGAACDTPVVSTDLYATMLEAAGLDGGARDGLSLRPLAQDPKARLPRNELYFHYPHYYPTTTPVSAIREGDWKLVEYYEDGRVELYDLREDPSESRDLAASVPDRARRMRAKLAAWKKETGARLPERNGNLTGARP
ncbi:MAG: sulfatase [Bryobacteraceae bacterium]